jgi:hypothetical protein
MLKIFRTAIIAMAMIFSVNFAFAQENGSSSNNNGQTSPYVFLNVTVELPSGVDYMANVTATI